ncbi:MAG TPA: rod shape-determining protein RodA [Alphaproteobacteria bacterium]|nr:rod shape-determining protein RodA [Rhodospirillaceae bacterium]HRI76423.1 rod shape-determining protein RodA [Alphaproteobacteria bacterium]HRJ67637.1 rod shape-determining protein RodA [Alphaproteobacteria bacterium]
MFNRDNLTLPEKFFSISWTFVALLVMVGGIGFMSLYSADGGNADKWATPHGLRLIVGLVGLVITAMIDIRLWLRFSYAFYALCVGLLVFVEIKGHIGMGAQRWIDLGLLRLQPSELMKIAVVLALARYYHGRTPDEIRNPLFLLPPIGIALLPVGLVFLQPNLGTAAIILMIVGAMMFVAGVSYWFFLIVGSGVVAAVPVLWSFMHDYQKRRVMTFLNPESDPLGAGYNIIQSKIALGSGGISGKGFLKGTQGSLNFLPEKQTDFIFTLFTEEWGLIGGLGLIGLLVAIIVYAYFIAFNCQSQFGRLLVMGIIINFSLYIFINIGMVMGLLPVVGVPLPMISYGGSSMLSVLFGFGLLMSAHVHRHVKFTRRGMDMV